MFQVLHSVGTKSPAEKFGLTVKRLPSGGGEAQ
jgi:hypothetical protein